ncbi:uncharacterized protein Pyn_40993 [Prunus yedoensis var. nudiflora]|uniref:Uncharacterized protein n=1 Tax=Prunus yedoensis var. nudiflora TaxID=2094558 RepID=A0A314YMY8_PRUYE|nr:uncharacterized protein Pyn_40993 [Prunus yedoensis var. nudiflora]
MGFDPLPSGCGCGPPPPHHGHRRKSVVEHLRPPAAAGPSHGDPPKRHNGIFSKRQHWRIPGVASAAVPRQVREPGALRFQRLGRSVVRANRQLIGGIGSGTVPVVSSEGDQSGCAELWLIYFDVGVVDKQFSLSLFESPPDCTAVDPSDPNFNPAAHHTDRYSHSPSGSSSKIESQNLGDEVSQKSELRASS